MALKRVKYSYPLLNFLNGGRITAVEEITQWRPTRTFARSPLIMTPFCTITLPLKTIFWDPHNTLSLLTLFPVACKDYVGNEILCRLKYGIVYLWITIWSMFSRAGCIGTEALLRLFIILKLCAYEPLATDWNFILIQLLFWNLCNIFDLRGETLEVKGCF